MSERGRTRRWVRVALIAVGLGVVSTVASVALLPHWPWQRYIGLGGPAYGRIYEGRWRVSYVEVTTLARSGVHGSRRECPEWMETDDEVEGWQRQQDAMLEDLIVRQGMGRSAGVPRWGTLARVDEFVAGAEPGAGFVQVAHGWPFRAAWMECVGSDPFRDMVIRGGWGRVDVGKSTSMHLWVPWRPLWGGLVGDVAVHAAGWLGVMGIVWGARRWLRSRRVGPGMCEGCGYDLGGLREAGCPECGLGRTVSEA